VGTLNGCDSNNRYVLVKDVSIPEFSNTKIVTSIVMKTNLEIVLELYANFDRGDFDLVRELLAEDFLAHYGGDAHTFRSR
jgi:hypothetical protein